MHNDINLKNKSNKAISLEHLALSLTEDFKKVSLLAGFNLPENAITTESLSAPHIPPTLPEGKMGVYVFIFNNHCLKVGKVGPESGNRYRHQHYNPKSSNSNLAKSLLMEQDKIGIDNLTENDVGYWIKDHTDRLNFIMNNELGIQILTLLEVFIQCRLNPLFEGFNSQRKKL